MKSKIRMKNNILIIGCGIGGLSTACLLAAKGHSVTIIEKGNSAGGCCKQTKTAEFTINWGADYITSPNLIKEIYDSVGLKNNEKLDLIPLEPNIRFISPEDEHFDLSTDKKIILEEIGRISPTDRQGFLDLDTKYDEFFQNDLSQAFEGSSNLLNEKFKLSPELIRLRTLPHIQKLTTDVIKNTFLQNVFSYHPLLVGGSPKQTNYFHQFNPFLFEEQQYCYVMGGMNSMIKRLEQILNDLGTRIIYNAEVSEILTQSHRVIGVRMKDGDIIPGDIVVSNADAMHTVNSLLPARYHKKVLKKSYGHTDFSSSLFILNLVVSTQVRDNGLSHHNVIIDKDLDKFSRDIFKNFEPSTENVFSLHIPTMIDDTLVPAKHDIIKICIPVPNLSARINWKNFGWQFRSRMIDYLEERFFPSLRSNIIFEKHIDPEYFHENLNYHLGAVYSLQPKLEQILHNRFHNQSAVSYTHLTLPTN